jgi:hypothetical protein
MNYTTRSTSVLYCINCPAGTAYGTRDRPGYTYNYSHNGDQYVAPYGGGSSNSSNSGPCLICPEGTYSDGNDCIACPDNAGRSTTTSGWGASSAGQCNVICSSGIISTDIRKSDNQGSGSLVTPIYKRTCR